MSDPCVLAYLAGAIDADGYFSIKRSTYSARVKKDSHNPSYTPLVGLKQITKSVPDLLEATFGGSIYQQAPSTDDGRWLWEWRVVSRAAVAAATSLLPYLLIKRERANCLIELQETITETKYRRLSYWFEIENPDWRSSPLLTTKEVATRLGYSSVEIAAQAIENGTLLGVPGVRGISAPRVPEALVKLYEDHMHGAKKQRVSKSRPVQLMDWRGRIWDRLRLMNQIGVTGTDVTHRVGVFTPKEFVK